MWPDWGISSEATAHFKRLRTASLVGASTMKRFNWHVGQQIMLRGTLYPFNVTLTIVGTMSGKAPPELPDLPTRLPGGGGRAASSDFVDNFWVRVDQASSVPQVISVSRRGFRQFVARRRSASPRLRSWATSCRRSGCF